MAAFQFYLQSGKQRKVGWVQDNSRVGFGKKNSLVKRKCETVCCHDTTASSFVAKFGVKFLHIFTRSIKKVTIVCRIDCLAYQGKFFFDVKK
jgi:hypothetical protein